MGPLQPGVMPTCNIHEDQMKRSTWCRASLPCGFQCGRICAWKPNGFQLCPDHQQQQMTCYLLKIPIELRFRIYGLLLPDMPVAALFKNSTGLRSDGGTVYTSLLRA